MGWYLEVLVNFANFGGRASRSEYWWFNFYNLVVIVALAVVLRSTPASLLLFWLYLAAMILPSLSVSVRRLHDTDRSGWWLLLGLVPFGSLVLLVFYVSIGTPGTNSYGARSESRTSPSPQVVATRNALVEDNVMRLYELYKSGAMSSEEYQTRREALFAKK